MIGVIDKGIVDKKTLYTVVSALHEECDHCLTINYRELNDDVNEQYWGCMLGLEISLD